MPALREAEFPTREHFLRVTFHHDSLLLPQQDVISDRSSDVTFAKKRLIPQENASFTENLKIVRPNTRKPPRHIERFRNLYRIHTDFLFA